MDAKVVGMKGLNSAHFGQVPAPLVLIIDDDDDLRNLYAAALDMVGIEVEVAHNAAAGWTAARTLHPDLVLVDIDLGDSNGLDLLDQLRAHTWPGRPPRLVMFTNENNPAFLTRAAAAGADGYLVKFDVRLPQFIEAMTKFLDRSGDEPAMLA